MTERALDGAGSSPQDGVKMALPAQHAFEALIVDDSTQSRELLAGLLRMMSDLPVRHARNGEEGLSLFTARRSLVTFLDIDMGETDGLDVLQELRALDPSAFVVMVSAHASASNVQKALSLGAGGFIVKPFRPQKLMDALKRAQTLTGRNDILRPER